MKSPIILSTGVTYYRFSIQRWLDDGNNTCPTTMKNRRHLTAVTREEIEFAVKNIRSLSKIAAFAEESKENRKVIVKMEGFLGRGAVWIDKLDLYGSSNQSSSMQSPSCR
ncbi:U-box domain-containing protein 28 [Linum perenne]